MVKITVSGELNGKNVTATWDDGDIYGDPALIKKMLDIAADKLYLNAPPPRGLIPIRFSTPTSWIPLARLALDKVTGIDTGKGEKEDKIDMVY